MKKDFLLVLLALPLILGACSKDTGLSAPAASQAKYVFESVQFLPVNSSEAATIKSYNRSPFIFTNRTSITQTAVLGTKLKSSSDFSFGLDLDTLLQKLDTVFVQVPVSFGANGQPILGTDTWPLVNSYIDRPLKKDPTRVSVAAFEELTVTGIITEQELKTKVMVTLRDEYSDKQKQIMGTWTGIIPAGEDLDYHVEDLKK